MPSNETETTDMMENTKVKKISIIEDVVNERLEMSKLDILYKFFLVWEWEDYMLCDGE